MTNKYLSAAVAHFKSLGTPHLDIPEWVVDGAPMRVYWKPLTVDERASIFDGGVAKDDLEIVMMKAIDADGKKMFTLEDKPALKLSVAPQIISRIAVRMMALPTTEQVEKN